MKEYLEDFLVNMLYVLVIVTILSGLTYYVVVPIAQFVDTGRVAKFLNELSFKEIFTTILIINIVSYSKSN